MKISACLIVKNEEKNIRRCIESYKKIVSEVIVVDTGSEDSTVSIAKELGAKIYYYEWNNSFCKAKNFALGKAKGDWIIFLDADEYFNGTNKIVQILNSINKKSVDCLVNKLINIDKNAGLVQDMNSIVRIFRNSPRIRYKNDIHEVLYKINKSLSAHMVEEKDIVIYHTGYSSDIIESKVERNIKLIEETMIKNNDSSGYYYLCDSYFAIKKYQLAIENGNRFIDSGVIVIGFNSKAYKNIIESMINLRYNNNEIKKVINRAKEIFQKHPMFYYYEALISYSESKYSSSLEYFYLTLEYQEKYKGIEMNIIPSLIYLIYCYMAEIFEIKNDNAKAIEYYVLSLKQNKYFEKVFINLINLIENQLDEDIIILLNTIYDINKEKDVKFIIDEFIKKKIGKVLMYYWNIWSKVFKKEDSIRIEGNNNVKKELENYKIKVKETITELVNSNSLEEAKELCDEYESIVKDDIEIFSIKSIVAIMENRLNDAENILNEGLKIDINNFDLLYNLGYLYQVENNLDLSIDYYKRALVNAKKSDMENAVFDILKSMGVGDSVDEIKKIYN